MIKSKASEVFPSYFNDGRLWRCADDLFLIQHPEFAQEKVVIPDEYFCFLLITRGWMKIKLDGKPIELMAGMSVAALANHQVDFIGQDDDMDGYVYILSKRLGDVAFVKKGIAIYSGWNKNPVSVYSDYAMRVTLDIAAVLKDVMDHPYSEQMQDVCASVLSVYFRLAASGKIWQSQDSIMESNRYNLILARFTGLLEKFYQRERMVKFYADQLCVTPKYLSACTKQVSGHTANWWINSYVLRDATQMLMNGNMSVKAIAARLNFEDQMLFGKYFRRQMGMSPSEYKKQELKRLKEK